jgi:hypothetical protein
MQAAVLEIQTSFKHLDHMRAKMTYPIDGPTLSRVNRADNKAMLALSRLHKEAPGMSPTERIIRTRHVAEVVTQCAAHVARLCDISNSRFL